MFRKLRLPNVARFLLTVIISFGAWIDLNPDFLPSPAWAQSASKSTASISSLTPENPGAAAKIVNGQPTVEYPSTGFILNKGRAFCTGTLISPNKVLTARHCVEGVDTANLQVFFQHAGRFAVEGPALVPPIKFVRPTTCGAGGDIAILALAAAVTGIKPMSFTSDSFPALGSIVGFGLTSSGGSEVGLKYRGSVLLKKCTFSPNCNVQAAELLCWQYKGGETTADTCRGDSGGPLFLADGSNEPFVAGVTSGGTDFACGQLNTDLAYDTSTEAYKDWISSVVAAESGRSLDDLDPLPFLSPQAVDLRYSGVSLSSKTGIAYSFDVRSAKVLRVSFNQSQDSQFDLALWPEGDANNSLGCSVKAEHILAFCEVKTPKEGRWHLSIAHRNESDLVKYQITASVF